MTDYLCSDFAGNGESDIVSEYLTQVAADAKISGFDFNYMRSQLYSVHTEIVSQDNSEAEGACHCSKKTEHQSDIHSCRKVLFYRRNLHSR